MRKKVIRNMAALMFGITVSFTMTMVMLATMAMLLWIH